MTLRDIALLAGQGYNLDAEIIVATGRASRPLAEVGSMITPEDQSRIILEI